MQNEEIEFFFEDEAPPIQKPQLELDDLGLFGKENDNKEIWNDIQNNNIEELKKQLFVYEGIAPKSGQVLCLKAIITYLNKDKQAKNLMIEAIKNVDYKNQRYFEFLIFIADRLKEFYSDKKTLLSIDSYIIQTTIYFHNDLYFNDIFKIVCKSGFELIQNISLTIEEKKDIYIILFHFLHDFKYFNLDKENYKLYLKYYTRVLWVLRDEFPKIVKEIFEPLFGGIIYKSMELETDEEKIKKLVFLGIDEAVAREIIKVLKG